MRALKDSGIEWIGEIPEDWELKRLKAIFLERKEKNDPQKTDFILSLGAAYGVVPYSEKEGGGNKAKEDLTAYRLAYPDDIVMNSMNIISGSVGISKYFGCVSPVYYMLSPRTEGVNQHYYCKMFQTKAFQRSLLGLGNGILMKETENGNFNTVRMRIPMEKLGVQLLPVPSLEEQKRIADFLDHTCAEIDTVIEKTKATIEEYKKLKQSVITEAVTKGVRGDRPMKDSGIDWIGKIPAEWDVACLKRYCRFKTGGTPSTINPEWFDGELNWFTPTDFNEHYYLNNSQRKLSNRAKEDGVAVIIPANTVLIIGIGGTAGKVGLTKVECSCNQQITAFLTDKVDSAYLMYWLIANSQFLKDTALYTTLPILNNETIGEYLFIVPNEREEQKEIADFLDSKCAEIDKLIADKTHLLEEMESYKKSVIYEYVTGKKEVTP